MVEVVFAILLMYLVSLFALSRTHRAPHESAPPREDLFFIFTIPCLNEDLVIGRTLEALLALPQENFAILVVDDGSQDGTGDVVRGFDPERVWLLERRPPDARKGKGDALNGAYRFLLESGVLGGRDPRSVIVSVFDADGRIDGSALTTVSRYFAGDDVGAVQIGVDMRNAQTNVLARLQDVEFTVFTEIFQKARQRLGSVGLGGNGQFVRLAALQSLGARPWSHCLTEDLDLGIRLLLAGWRNRYCPEAAVNQQAVTSLRAWLRQRARWFQGHLQCWRLIPTILRSRLGARTASDLIWYLTLPVGVVLAPLVVLPVLAGIVLLLVTAPWDFLAVMGQRNGLVAGLLYGLMVAPAYFYAWVYWRSGKASVARSLPLAHVFEFYAYLWFVAGWLALSRIARRKGGWAKTARVVEGAAPQPARASAFGWAATVAAWRPPALAVYVATAGTGAIGAWFVLGSLYSVAVAALTVSAVSLSLEICFLGVALRSQAQRRPLGEPA
jgi:cellulose synthase/poly-beta-1,6-N-acetylglucosamine synthase-like glycosyltransferase